LIVLLCLIEQIISQIWQPVHFLWSAIGTEMLPLDVSLFNFINDIAILSSNL